MFGDYHSHNNHVNNHFTATIADFGSDAFPTLPPNEIRKSLPNESLTTILTGAKQRSCTFRAEVFE